MHKHSHNKTQSDMKEAVKRDIKHDETILMVIRNKKRRRKQHRNERRKEEEGGSRRRRKREGGGREAGKARREQGVNLSCVVRVSP